MYVIVLTINLPVRSALRTMCVRGNPRGARHGYVDEACRQAAARPISAVTVDLVPQYDRADRATLGGAAAQAAPTQKAGDEDTARRTIASVNTLTDILRASRPHHNGTLAPFVRFRRRWRFPTRSV